MLACHVGGLAWSGVSSAIVRLYNCLCVRGAYVLSAPVPTSSTFYQVFMGRLAWSGVLTGVSQTCMSYMDRLAWSGVAKYGARGHSRKGPRERLRVAQGLEIWMARGRAPRQPQSVREELNSRCQCVETSPSCTDEEIIMFASCHGVLRAAGV